MISAIDDWFSWDGSFPANVRAIKLLTFADVAAGKRRKKKRRKKQRHKRRAKQTR